MDVMTSDGPPSVAADAAPYEGYDEATLDAFFRAMAEERVRLQVNLDAADRREQRARALIGMHDVMVATMRDAYADVTAMRRAAAVRAAETVKHAERRIVEICAGVDGS